MAPRRKIRSEAIFQAIADPTRRRMLSLLRERPLAVGELAQNFRVSRPAISKHLRILEAAGLVVARRRGTARLCTLNAAPLRTVNDWLDDYRSFWSETLRALKSHVEEN